MSDFLIACGGTGGHLTPGIALAEEMERRGYSSLLLVSKKRIDQTLTEKYPQRRFDTVSGAPLLLTVPGVVRFVSTQAKGFLHAWGLIRREKPRLVMGFGGFTTAAVIVAAWVLRVPVALHESNRVPGRAVRALARFARRVYLPRGIKLPHTDIAKLRHAGLPVRDEIKRRPRGEAAEKWGLDPNRRTVVLLGGSQGAQALNRWASAAAPVLAERGVQMLIVTGPGKGDGGTQTFPDLEGQAVATVSIPFCDDMAAAMSLADLVVSRSGAGTLAELIEVGVPAVLVPYPFAADNHQSANAQEFANHGAGLVVEETSLGSLTELVVGLVLDDERLTAMRSEITLIARASTLPLMFDDIEKLATGGTKTSPPFPRYARA
ncbi:UDP-N-acetylglucosamine--N-acetylmuramyl-(pentapeptide) pyrophosphoryl-undecaprenol N-acetylglucosamine transferase [Actomonas aquatica]|uniref:UDP-N-acetylglucosamine--N-acetylmuramyl-(pentapeptide) pyrophosphoryl-undecaprenol N-acetylglucosamine transferase n=1 Tax=Actomonas aquatica TaxID=2866162 RepID=A0ABZ1CCD2_9BACT|nr:UDP-N-acetylglucosamine--N-acetylmuramyl-(pentapeptide) pyrophosphoryl-undecaprenol N-acetylglucosamine transferase [Opitutus sp. WL0086]WRQ89102.1 UDP-N-acetylglucosamine--N-acetylmuramyl-(pentapeptide) pyrophosphoryl-undecaprenol N-acetylglucosamine transferase [Opitutus sp. WL0086]